MKKALSLLLLILLIISLITGCSVNNAIVQNHYSIRSDPSNIIYFFGNCLNLSKEDLAWCRYYEILPPEETWILVQYKEKNENSFNYFLTEINDELDEFNYTNYDLPLALEARVVDEQNGKYYTRTKLAIDSTFGVYNFVLYSNKQGLIEVMIINKNANDVSASMNDCMAYKFVYNDKKLIELVYEIAYSDYYYDYETWSIDESLPELSGDLSEAENYIFNEDGSLSEQNNSSYRYLFSYDHNLRSTVEVYYNYNGMDKLRQRIEYTRNNNGVTSSLLSIRYNIEDQTIQSEWHDILTYNGNHLTVDEH